MEAEIGAEIDFVSDNADYNQITISCNTSCNRDDGCMHSFSDDKIHICRLVATNKVKEC